MKFCCGLFFFLAISSHICAQNIASVEAFDEQGNNPSQLTLRLRITNASSDTLNNVRARYFLNNYQNRVLNVSPYYMEEATTSIDTLGDFLAINIDIAKLAPGVFPNVSGISLGVNDTIYRDLRKSEHFSYPGTGNFTSTNNIPLYVNGTVLTGSTPIGDEIPKIRFVGIQPENSDTRSAWVELENYGSTDINLNDYFLKWTVSDSVSFGNAILPAGNKIRVCQSNDSLECPSADVVAVKNVLPFDSVGELVVSNAGFPIDYIAWGSVGNMSDSIRMINERLETGKFFETIKERFFGPKMTYVKGSFYRAVISRNDSLIIRWNLFPANQIDANSSSMPSAGPLSLFDSSIVYLASNEKMSFAWVPIDGAKSYDLIVVNASDSTLVYEKVTKHTSEKVDLPYGEYLWGVASFEDELQLGFNLIDFVIPGGSAIENFINALENAETSPKVTWTDLLLKNSEAEIPIYNLGVIPQAARKDSYMLDLKWGQFILNDSWDAPRYTSWDSPRNLSSYVDGNWDVQFYDDKEKYLNREEDWRCWIVATSMLNHYNRGNLTQDEIKFHIFGTKDPVLGAFPQGEDGSGYDEDINEALRWALNLPVSKLHYSLGRPSESTIVQMLSERRPVVIGQNQHIMIIDAVKKDAKTGEFSFRFLNTDNEGNSEWRVYKNISGVVCAWFPELTTSPKMSELYEDLNDNGIMEADYDRIFDTDGDGILDFDEDNRFHSLKNSDDSDGDEIKDKIEIMSYTLYEPYEVGGVAKETVADIDGDKKRAEMDDDSDNGGRKDGLEDLNKNGIKEIGETNPYIAFDDYNSSNPMVPGEYALYASSNLRVNDGVKCYDGAVFCNVGAASINSVETFPLIVGARASVGNVYSRRNVFFRSYSHIYGNVYLENGSYIDNVSFQNGTIIDGDVVPISIADALVYFPVIYPMINYDVSDAQNLEVLSERTVDLYDGTRYASLKVNSNGKIRIYPGEIWVGNLQLEPGAKIEFVAPGYQTVFHVNGSFIWRGTILNNGFTNETIAKGFKLIQHSSKKMYVDEKFFGTIVAPASHVILGQANKTFYGSVMANDISVHQYTNIYYVKFNPTTMMYSFNF